MNIRRRDIQISQEKGWSEEDGVGVIVTAYTFGEDIYSRSDRGQEQSSWSSSSNDCTG